LYGYFEHVTKTVENSLHSETHSKLPPRLIFHKLLEESKDSRDAAYNQAIELIHENHIKSNFHEDWLDLNITTCKMRVDNKDVIMDFDKGEKFINMARKKPNLNTTIGTKEYKISFQDETKPNIKSWFKLSNYNPRMQQTVYSQKKELATTLTDHVQNYYIVCTLRKQLDALIDHFETLKTAQEAENKPTSDISTHNSNPTNPAQQQPREQDQDAEVHGRPDGLGNR